MGFCSATGIFDPVAKFILGTDKPENEKVEVLMVLAEALEDEDWDCQQDSRYWDDPIVQTVFRALHPSWFAENSSEAHWIGGDE